MDLSVLSLTTAPVSEREKEKKKSPVLSGENMSLKHNSILPNHHTYNDAGGKKGL